MSEALDYRVKLSFYVPVDYTEAVKAAIFAAGAGQLGDYRYCSWQTLGYGQFLPIDGAAPALGKVGTLTQVAEHKVEVLCDARLAEQIEAALLAAHPYEVPAYEFVRLWGPTSIKGS
jgi:hypothetical protein